MARHLNDELPLVYVAGRYRGPTAWDVAQNVHRATALGFQVAALGAVPVIPHAMYAQFDGTLTDRFWLDATSRILVPCAAVITVPGWETSEGTRAEVEQSLGVGRPVFHALRDLETWLARSAR